MSKENPGGAFAQAAGSSALFSPEVQALDFDHPRRKRIRKEFWRGEFEAIELKIENENLRAENWGLRNSQTAYERCSDELMRVNEKYIMALNALKHIAAGLPSSPRERAKNALEAIAGGGGAKRKNKEVSGRLTDNTKTETTNE